MATASTFRLCLGNAAFFFIFIDRKSASKYDRTVGRAAEGGREWKKSDYVSPVEGSQ